MYKKNSLVCTAAAVLTAAVISISAYAELSLPEVIWRDGIAFDKTTDTVLSNCAAFDPENAEFVLLGPDGTEIKRAGSYAELVNADKRNISTLEIKADVPEGFNVPVVILIENDIGNEYEIELYDYNSYKSLTNLGTGGYTVNDCFVRGDNKGRYAIESASGFELPNDGMVLNIKVDDTDPAIPYIEKNNENNEHNENRENNRAEDGINNISFPEKQDIHTSVPSALISPEPSLPVLQNIEPQSAGEMGKPVVYANPVTPVPAAAETMITDSTMQGNNMQSAAEKSGDEGDVKTSIWKPIAVNILILVIFFISYFLIKKFMLRNRNDRRD